MAAPRILKKGVIPKACGDALAALFKHRKNSVVDLGWERFHGITLEIEETETRQIAENVSGQRSDVILV